MRLPFESVVIVGLGYIGLPTAAVMASRGVKVTGVDIDEGAVSTINRGEIHIVEPDLDGLVHGVVKGGLLRAATKPERADAFIIAVPTPFKEDHEPDLSYVESAASSIAGCLRPGNLVVLESTSPVGTTERIERILAAARPDLTFPARKGKEAQVNIAYCPERVLPGRILAEIVENDRVVGGLTATCAQRAASLYRIFVKGECHLTNARTAEMCKLTENAFRDVNIAFANELSLICDKLDINVWQLIHLANRHPRVKILQPGPGVGGHCIAVDPWFIVSSAPRQSLLIRTAREVNDGKPRWVLERVHEMVAALGKPRTTIACLGLAFKADIDDLRESPAMDIAATLGRQPDIDVLASEPNISQLPPSLKGCSVRLVEADEALQRADIVVLLVDHREFKQLDWSRFDKPILDTRGVLSR